MINNPSVQFPLGLVQYAVHEFWIVEVAPKVKRNLDPESPGHCPVYTRSLGYGGVVAR